jgi:hypothetical protein
MAINNQYPWQTSQVDLSYTHIPEAFQPLVLDKAIQNKYVLVESLRQFLTAAPKPMGMLAYGYLEYGETVGDVDWLGERDNLPVVDETYEQRMISVRSYGGKVRWTLSEQETNAYGMIGQRQDSVMNLMRNRENTTIMTAMIAALDESNLSNDHDMSDWSDTSAGTPAQDIKKASNIIAKLTGKAYRGDVLIMNTTTEEYLYEYDFVQNNLYTQAQFNETGQLSRLAGLPIVSIEEVPDEYFFVFQSGILGDWMTTEGVRTVVWQVDPRKFEQWVWTTAEPAITHPRVQFRGHIANL